MNNRNNKTGPEADGPAGGKGVQAFDPGTLNDAMAGLKWLTSNLAAIRISLTYVATMEKEYYDALIAQGFTPADAIYLVGKHGSNPGVGNQNKEDYE